MILLYNLWRCKTDYEDFENDDSDDECDDNEISNGLYTNVAAVLFLIHSCTIITPLIAPPLPGILEGQYTDFFYITHDFMIIYRHF